VRWLKAGYRRLLLFVERAPALIIGCVVVLTVAGLATLASFRSAFLPAFAEGHFIVHATGVPGSSLEESLRIGKQVSAALLKAPYVRLVADRVGRASLRESRGPYASEMDVDLQPGLNGRQNRQALAGIRKALEKFPGLTFTVNTF